MLSQPTNHSMRVAMDPSQVGAIPTPRSHPSPAANGAHASQPFIKDEHSDSEDGTYKPRPQLPKPFVFMRNLAQLISTRSSENMSMHWLTSEQRTSTQDLLTLIRSINAKLYGQVCF